MEAEALDLFTHSDEMFRNKDLDGLVGRLTDNGSLKLPNAALLTGKDAIHANYEGAMQFENFVLDQSVRHVKVSEAGDMGGGGGIVKQRTAWRPY